jgi:hypothetical protein
VTIVEQIEQQVQGLRPDQLAEFRAWFLEYDWQAWDRQIEAGGKEGKLAALARAALEEHASGRTKPL